MDKCSGVFWFLALTIEELVCLDFELKKAIFRGEKSDRLRVIAEKVDHLKVSALDMLGGCDGNQKS